MTDPAQPSSRNHVQAEIARDRSAAQRFFGGFAAGLLGPSLLLLLGVFIVNAVKGLDHVGGPPPPTTRGAYVSSGLEISRAGGAAVEWRRPGETTRQTCRGPCDDLAFERTPAKAVEVRDAEGRRVAPGGSEWRPKLVYVPWPEP